MKIMVTGAAGFIGSQLAHALWKNENELILIDNFSYGKMDNLEFEDHSFADEIIKMDIRDRDGIARLLKPGDIDYIYNIAGIAPLPDCQTNPQEAIDVNVIGTVNLLLRNSYLQVQMRCMKMKRSFQLLKINLVNQRLFIQILNMWRKGFANPIVAHMG